MAQADSASSTFASIENAAAIAAKNDRARLSIGREVEELLRIGREEDQAAFRLIDLLDLEEPDPDLEPSFGGDGISDDGFDREADPIDDEPSLGWTSGINQAGRQWHGEPVYSQADGNWSVVDGEAEHDGREPCCEDEGAACEDEGAQAEDWSEGTSSPAYYGRL